MKFGDYSAKESGQNLPFIKLKDGEKIIGVFKGDPYEFGLIWEGKKQVPVGTDKSSFRFRINFIVKEGASYVPKIFENGITVYNMLKELHERYPLGETAVEIKRKGSTKDDTSYTVFPLPPTMQPNQNSWRVINQTKLIDLVQKPVAKGATEPAFDDGWSEGPPPEDVHDEIPF